MDLLTYDEIRQVERNEREKKALIKLPSDFIARYLNYVKDKSRVLSKEDDNIIAKKVKERARKELFNAESSFKSLFELRARKVIDQAFIDIRMGTSGVLDNMTPEEKNLYKEVRALIEAHEQSLLKGGGNFKKPQINPKKDEGQDPYVLVRFLKDVPLFAWKDGELGPFKKEDVANIPRDLVPVLKKQGSIKIMG